MRPMRSSSVVSASTDWCDFSVGRSIGSPGTGSAPCAMSTLPWAEQWEGTSICDQSRAPRTNRESTWATSTTWVPRGTPRWTVSPVRSASSCRKGSASRPRSRPGSWPAAYSLNSGPARKEPSPSRASSMLRSRAASRREVVERGSPVSSASALKASGSSARTTRASSVAARSTACVPVMRHLPATRPRVPYCGTRISIS